MCINYPVKDHFEVECMNPALPHSPAVTKKARNNWHEQTVKILSTLAPREEMILRMHFGISRQASTLEELSQQFSLRRGLLRQIEVQALRKLRERGRYIYPRAPHTLTVTSFS